MYVEHLTTAAVSYPPKAGRQGTEAHGEGAVERTVPSPRRKAGGAHGFTGVALGNHPEARTCMRVSHPQWPERPRGRCGRDAAPTPKYLACRRATGDTDQAMSEANVEIARGARIALGPLPGGAGQRRTLDERLRVRFPTFFRAFNDAVLRLPPRSRLRRAALARAIIRAYAAANRRDFELIFTSNDPGAYEYCPSADLLPPDFDTVYQGHQGYLDFWQRWLDAFPDIRWDPEEIIDLGQKALVTTRQSGHGSGSGLAVSERVFQLFTFRRGLVIRQEDFLDRSQALEAAGLSE